MTLHTTFLEQQKEFEKLFDSHFEMNVHDTDKHPNCKYILSCKQHGVLEKDIFSFHKQSFLKLIEAVEGEIEKMRIMYEPITPRKSLFIHGILSVFKKEKELINKEK